MDSVAHQALSTWGCCNILVIQSLPITLYKIFGKFAPEIILYPLFWDPIIYQFYAPRTVHSGFFMPNVNGCFSFFLWGEAAYRFMIHCIPLKWLDFSISTATSSHSWNPAGDPTSLGWRPKTLIVPILKNLGGQPTHGITKIRPFSGLTFQLEGWKGYHHELRWSIQPH